MQKTALSQQPMSESTPQSKVHSKVLEMSLRYIMFKTIEIMEHPRIKISATIRQTQQASAMLSLKFKNIQMQSRAMSQRIIHHEALQSQHPQR